MGQEAIMNPNEKTSIKPLDQIGTGGRAASKRIRPNNARTGLPYEPAGDSSLRMLAVFAILLLSPMLATCFSFSQAAGDERNTEPTTANKSK